MALVPCATLRDALVQTLGASVIASLRSKREGRKRKDGASPLDEEEE